MRVAQDTAQQLLAKLQMANTTAHTSSPSNTNTNTKTNTSSNTTHYDTPKQRHVGGKRNKKTPHKTVNDRCGNCKHCRIQTCRTVNRAQICGNCVGRQGCIFRLPCLQWSGLECDQFMVSQCLKNEACANSNGLNTVYSVPLLHKV